jgi:hypothetical protein
MEEWRLLDSYGYGQGKLRYILSMKMEIYFP